MDFSSIKTPEELMTYLNENFDYGVIDNKGNKFFDSNTDEFQFVCNNDWKLRSVDQMLNDKIGHCYDQVEIERKWFESNGYKIKTFWSCAYQENIENSGFSHTYLLYKSGNYWYLFEHADYYNRGIHKFKTIKEAARWQINNQIKFAESCVPPQDKYSYCIKEYPLPPLNLNMQEYIDFVDKSKDFVL